MKIAKYILTTLVAVTAAFQPLTAVTGSAQVHINAENTAKTLTKDELINDMSFLLDLFIVIMLNMLCLYYMCRSCRQKQPS